MPTPSQEQTIAHLSTAIHELLAAIVLMGGLPDDIPADALDAAIKIDPTVQEARQRFQTALQGMRDTVGKDSILYLEEAANALAARCAEAGYRIGQITRL